MFFIILIAILILLYLFFRSATKKKYESETFYEIKYFKDLLDIWTENLLHCQPLKNTSPALYDRVLLFDNENYAIQGSKRIYSNVLEHISKRKRTNYQKTSNSQGIGIDFCMNGFYSYSFLLLYNSLSDGKVQITVKLIKV